ncbi:MAG: hypothetical protein H6679_04435 [Epsilonproteobacteria bacterium]|nr:hypothetical protein [Campylobacterota bacterium]
MQKKLLLTTLIFLSIQNYTIKAAGTDAFTYEPVVNRTDADACNADLEDTSAMLADQSQFISLTQDHRKELWKVLKEALRETERKSHHKRNSCVLTLKHNNGAIITTQTKTGKNEPVTFNWCTCESLTNIDRIKIILTQLAQLNNNFPPKTQKTIVHTSFGAGVNFLQQYLLAKGLEILGYENIGFNFIEPVEQDFERTTIFKNQFGNKLTLNWYNSVYEMLAKPEVKKSHSFDVIDVPTVYNYYIDFRDNRVVGFDIENFEKIKSLDIDPNFHSAISNFLATGKYTTEYPKGMYKKDILDTLFAELATSFTKKTNVKPTINMWFLVRQKPHEEHSSYLYHYIFAAVKDIMQTAYLIDKATKAYPEKSHIWDEVFTGISVKRSPNNTCFLINTLPNGKKQLIIDGMRESNHAVKSDFAKVIADKFETIKEKPLPEIISELTQEITTQINEKYKKRADEFTVYRNRSLYNEFSYLVKQNKISDDAIVIEANERTINLTRGSFWPTLELYIRLQATTQAMNPHLKSTSPKPSKQPEPTPQPAQPAAQPKPASTQQLKPTTAPKQPKTDAPNEFTAILHVLKLKMLRLMQTVRQS